VLVGFLVSLLPAWQAGRVELQSALKREGAATAPARGFVQGGMAIAQLALCATLLVVAALFAQSFVRLQASALGFAPEEVRLFRVALDDSPRYGSGREQIAFQRALEDKIAALPGVTHVGVTTAAPFAPATHRMTTRIGGTATVLPAGELLSVERFNVGPDYFRALGTPLREGRFFDARDIAGAAPVAMLNEAAARRLWPGENAVGKTVSWNTPYTVVGVVADIRNVALDRPAQPALYVAAYQLARPQVTFAVKASTPDTALYDGIRRELRALDPGLPLFDARPLEEALWTASSRPRFNTGILGGFALVAVLLAGIGLYGITAYAVVRRTREFGLRMALGAQRREVLWLVLRRGVLQTALGVAAGLLLSVALAQTLRGLLHEVSATDPVTFAVIAVVLGVVALLACWLPALRATKVDPLVALRSE
jgi:putative ABC transport system permease protein